MIMIGMAGVVALAATAPASEIWIRITDRFGADLERAAVCAPSDDGSNCVPLVTSSLDRGTMRLAIPPSVRAIRVSSEGFETRDWELGDIRQTSTMASPAKLELRASGAVMATFALRTSRSEAASARLWRLSSSATRPTEVDRRPFVATNSPSKVRFENLPTGRYELAWEGPTLAYGKREVVVHNGLVDVGAIILAAGRTVEGFVVDETGSAISGARLRIERTDSANGLVQDVITDPGGLFSLQGLPVEEDLRWTASAAGFMEVQQGLGGDRHLAITLDRAWRIHGRLVRRDKTAIGEASIGVTYVLSEKPRVTAGVGGIGVSADGTFEVFLTRRARAILEMTASGFRKTRKDLAAPSADTPKDRDLGDLVMSEGRVVSGTVYDGTSGASLGGVLVGEVGPNAVNETSTDSNGRFSLAGLPVESDTALSFFAPKYARTNRRVPRGVDQVDVQLSVGGEIRGRVCASAEELTETTVSLSQASGSGDTLTATIGQDARFRFENLEPGRYSLSRSFRLESGGGKYSAIGTGESVSVSVEGNHVTEATVGCEGLPVLGTVSVDGRPLPRAFGWLSIDGQFAAPLRTDALGRFSTRVQAPGRLSATISAPSGLTAAGMTLSDPFCVVPPGGTDSCALAFAVVPSR